MLFRSANPPDVLYFPIFEPEAPLITAQVAEIDGLEETVLMSADGALVDSFPENAGDSAEGMYLSDWVFSSSSKLCSFNLRDLYL